MVLYGPNNCGQGNVLGLHKCTVNYHLDHVQIVTADLKDHGDSQAIHYHGDRDHIHYHGSYMPLGVMTD